MNVTEHRIRSFGRCNGRSSQTIKQARQNLWADFGLNIADGLLNVETSFGRKSPLFFEIGFGSGTSLLALAKQQPTYNFIGIETYKPAVGALLLYLKTEGIHNVRVYHADVIDVLTSCIAKASLDGVQIFFPDPWPKRRHHARRLIQNDFLRLLADKLKPQGNLFLATDWEDYAIHMMQHISNFPAFNNVAGLNCYAPRSLHRPVLTKFEQRALREGRQIWDLHFQRS